LNQVGVDQRAVGVGNFAEVGQHFDVPIHIGHKGDGNQSCVVVDRRTHGVDGGASILGLDDANLQAARTQADQVVQRASKVQVIRHDIAGAFAQAG
jgi:hypothetical protein